MACPTIAEALEAIFLRLVTVTKKDWPSNLPPFFLFDKYKPLPTNQRILSRLQRVDMVLGLHQFFERISPELSQQWKHLQWAEQRQCCRYVIAACEESRITGVMLQRCLDEILTEDVAVWDEADDQRAAAAAMEEYEAFGREDDAMADTGPGEDADRQGKQRDSGYFDSDNVSEYDLNTAHPTPAEMWRHQETRSYEAGDDGEWLARDLQQLNVASDS